MSATPAGANSASASTNGGSGSNANANANSNATGSAHHSKRLRIDHPASWRSSDDTMPLRKFTPTPSSGTAPLHSTHDYGHTEFYPVKDGYSEGQLTERTIRHGFVDIPRVENEYLSSHEVVLERLQDQRVFQELQSFAAGAAQRQWARGGVASTDFPRLPNRTVRSDERRDEWFRGLANPRVPLSVLANSMPFGIRGERLLDLLRQNQVPLQRAVWGIRLTGIYEMFGMQTRDPDHANLKALERQYTGQWSKQFTQFLENTLNSAPTTSEASVGLPADSMSPATPHRTSLASTTTLYSNMPSAWARSWKFCLSLLHAQYSQGLLDQRYFVSWIVKQFHQMPVDKCMLLLPLVQDYTPEIGKSRTPLRKLISAVSYWLTRSATHPSLDTFRNQVSEYLISLFTTFPDAFVEPSTWGTYMSALCDAQNGLETTGRAGRSNSLSYTALLKQVDARNARFGSISGSKRQIDLNDSAPKDKHLALLRTLESIAPDTNISTTFNRLFPDPSSSTPSTTTTLRLICYWAVEDHLLPASSQFRFVCSAKLCKMYIDKQQQAADADKGLGSSQVSAANEMQNAVVGFLDIFALPLTDDERKNAVWRICSLLEQLADVGCFSISKYLQLLTARGDFFGAKINSVRSKRQLEYALGIPTRCKSVEEQRHMVLGDWQASGPAAKELANQYFDTQSSVAARLRSEIASLLPFLIAYTCATPFRLKGNNKQPTVDADIVCWWALAAGEYNDGREPDLLDPNRVPKPSQFTRSKLLSPLAHSPCGKDWISPLLDHISDERLLSRDIPSIFLEKLHTCPRPVVDIVVNQRMMPIVYDYVVKDIKVGVDNWRVITRPGTSLLNRRQTAVIVRILAEARYFFQLLDFLLWLLGHTRVAQVSSLVHCTLRRYTRTWMLLGRLKHAVAQTGSAYASNAIGSDLFDFEYYRTAQHWRNSIEGDNENYKQDVESLFDTISKDYESFVSTHSLALLQSGHSPGNASASKDILQLAQQLARDRVRENIGSTADEIDWAILPCFQKLTRWAYGATQRAEYTSSPALIQSEVPNSPSANPAVRQSRLQSMLLHTVTDATQAALVTGKGLPLAPESSSDRPKDIALLRCFVELCALHIRWFAVSTGFAKTPEHIGPMLLDSLYETINTWTIDKNDSNLSDSSSAVGSPLYSVKDIDIAIHVSCLWINSLLAYGCMRIDDLVPWLIERCREEATSVNIARYTCLTGIIYALGMPTPRVREGRADTDNAHIGLPASSDAEVADSSNDLYSKTADFRFQYELLDAGSCWSTALETNQILRIQVAELVFISASASGRLRSGGASQLAAILMQATAVFAQSSWVQFAIDCIPLSIQESGATAHAVVEQKYYTMLEIYRANIERQIEDPGTALPVKRAMLRVLMVLCEGADPADEGFSAMTTAEVAHRLQETIHRFWNGPAIKGKATTAVSKLATILSSLLLFSSTALQESEASTEAFAVAAGVGGRTDSVGPNDSSHPIKGVGQNICDDGEQMQFVTNATACLALYIKETVLGIGPFSSYTDFGLPPAFSRRCAGLTDALTTLSANTLLKFVYTFSGSLLALDVAHLSVVGSDVEKMSGNAQHQQPQESQSVLDKRVSAIIESAAPADFSSLLEMSLMYGGAIDSDGMDVDTPAAGGSGSAQDKALFADKIARGAALTRLTQCVISKLCQSADFVSSSSSSNSQAQTQKQQQQQGLSGVVGSKAIMPGSMLSKLRDFACGVLGQLQAIAVLINPSVAELLSLTLSMRSSSRSDSSPFSSAKSMPYFDAESVSDSQAASGQWNQQQGSLVESAAVTGLGDMRVRLAIYRRLQLTQPLCHIMREYPDELGVGEWLMTLVALCLSPTCQPPSPSSLPTSDLEEHVRSGDRRQPESSTDDLSNCDFYQFLLDFTAVISESVTASMRKHILELLRLVSPIARTAICDAKHADTLKRLFPFDISIAPISDIRLVHSSVPDGVLDNPWVWVESLEFAPLAPLNSTSIPNGGLEGMTPFTLRGMLERENAACSEKTGSVAKGGVGGVTTGYLANLRFNTSRSSGPGRSDHSTATRRNQVASVRRLQYLENPYFPMQPAFLFPLAETPVPWSLFGGKRRRMDSETRLVWRAQCESAFGSGD
ncbi:hypothetical protein H4S06_000707 [Coemansia sp. BCRC 34490]|nr:hypothetical protein H4S06_000707 [Coemansia sp. BCRC 34490]